MINAFWGFVDFIVSSGSVLLLIPVLLKTIGQEMFGVMVIVNTVMGLSGVLSLGMGQATLKYVSEFRAKQQLGLISEVVQATFWIYCLTGFAASLLIFPLAKWMAISVFSVSVSQVAEASWAIRVGSLGFVFYLLFGVGENVFKGFERFDTPIIIRAVVRLSTLTAQVTLALLGFGLAWLIGVQVGAMLLGAIFILFYLKKSLVPDLYLFKTYPTAMLKKIFSYSFYTFSSGIFGMLRQSGDTFIIGAILGASDLAIYSIPLRLFSQIHGLLSRVSGYMFPYIGKLHALGDTAHLKAHYTNATWMICIASSVMVTPIAALSHSILLIWLGKDMASAATLIMQIVAFRFALFPLSIVNSYFLMATGEVRLMAIVTGVNCVLSLSTIGLLAYHFGIVGGAIGQLSIFIPVCINRCFIEKRMFGSVNIFGTIMSILGCITPLILVFALDISLRSTNILKIGLMTIFLMFLSFLISCVFYMLENNSIGLLRFGK